MFAWLCPVHRGKSKHKYNKSHKSKRQRASSFTHVTRQDRETITDLRQQGHSIRAIADLTGRSTRTVHKVLGEIGSDVPPDSIPDADAVREMEPGERLGLSRAAFRARLFEVLEPSLVENVDAVLNEHPEIAEAALFKALDIQPPHQPTFDDKVQELIMESPEHLRRVLDHRVAELLRGGESEFDIGVRWLELILPLAERLQNATWGHAARDLVQSGELSKTVSAITTALRSPTTVTPPPAPPPAPAAQSVPVGSTQTQKTEGAPKADEPPANEPKAPQPKETASSPASTDRGPDLGQRLV